jgi:hypothetical protein
LFRPSRSGWHVRASLIEIAGTRPGDDTLLCSAIFAVATLAAIQYMGQSVKLCGGNATMNIATINRGRDALDAFV